MHAVAKFLFFLGIAGAVASWWFKESPPPPEKLDVNLLEQPIQKTVRQKPFDVTVNGIDYRIQPRYSYDISAVVVSLHHTDSWWNYIHKQVGDYVNVLDFCLAWGESVRNGSYQDVSFSNSQFECHWKYSSQRAMDGFNGDEVSNNHVVTADPDVAKALKRIRVGDQIRLQGFLVDYTIMKGGQPSGTRVSSEKRDDRGPGACEVLYVDSLEPVASANRQWRTAFYAALGAIVLSILLWFVLPAKVD